MFTHPAITAALADQHRRDLTAQASASQIARAARDARPTRPGRSRQPRRITSPVQVIKRAVAAAAAAMAAAVLVMTPAGAATTTPHVSAHHFVGRVQEPV
jgi:hypothetical protein